MLNKRLGIDFGTAYSRVYLEGRGIILVEPTVAAVEEETGRVLAFGAFAKEMLGKTPAKVAAIRPVENGAISSYEIAEKFLTPLISSCVGPWLLFRPEVMLSVPTSATEVERRSLVDAVISAGAKEAYLIEQPLAAAIGAKIPIHEPSGSLVVSLGAGVCEAATISLGGIISVNHTMSAGNKIDQSLIHYLKKKHNLVIGENTAEKIKIEGKPVFEASGQDAVNGLPRSISLSSDETGQAMEKVIQEIIRCVKKTLEATPPELSADIVDRGLILVGGLAKLKGLSLALQQSTGIACHIAPNPELCTATGCGIAIENLEEFENLFAKR